MANEIILTFDFEAAPPVEDLGEIFTALARDYREISDGRTLVVSRVESSSIILTVTDARAKRFAKIGSEMVSLAAVEGLAQGLWPESNHAAVALPDRRKGEQIVLVTEKDAADREALVAYGRAQGLPELWLPRAVLVAPIPVIGSGKIDYPATAEMVRRLISDRPLSRAPRI